MKLSPLNRAYLERSAIIEERLGWAVAAHFLGAAEEAATARRAASLVDLTWFVKLDLQGRGLSGPPPSLPSDTLAVQLGVNHWLALGEPHLRNDLTRWADELQRSEPPVYTTDVTSVWSLMRLTGPKSEAILNKLTSANAGRLAPGAALQASVAHAPGILIRSDHRDILSFLLLTPRDYALETWEATLEAGAEFGIVPAGVDSLLYSGESL